jgi:hypothetical protein
VARQGSLGVPVDGLGLVHVHAGAQLVAQPQIAHSHGVALLSGPAIEFHRPGLVPRYAVAVLAAVAQNVQGPGKVLPGGFFQPFHRLAWVGLHADPVEVAHGQVALGGG